MRHVLYLILITKFCDILHFQRFFFCHLEIYSIDILKQTNQYQNFVSQSPYIILFLFAGTPGYVRGSRKEIPFSRQSLCIYCNELTWESAEYSRLASTGKQNRRTSFLMRRISLPPTATASQLAIPTFRIVCTILLILFTELGK